MTYDQIVAQYETLSQDDRKMAVMDYINGLSYSEFSANRLAILFRMELNITKKRESGSMYCEDLIHTDNKEGAMFRSLRERDSKKEKMYRFDEFRSCFARDLL
jgi:hypothetical protein